MTTTTIPSAIKCNFDTSSRGSHYASPCNAPAVVAVRRFRDARLEGRCKKHAAIDARRKYSPLASIEFTPAIVNEMMTDIADRKFAKAAENKLRAERARVQRLAWIERAKIEAALPFVVSREDEKGAPDFEATRQRGEVVRKPDTPRWLVRAKDDEQNVSWSASVTLDISEDEMPTKIDVHNSSELTINQARALVEALQAAIDEATQ